MYDFLKITHEEFVKKVNELLKDGRRVILIKKLNQQNTAEEVDKIEYECSEEENDWVWIDDYLTDGSVNEEFCKLVSGRSGTWTDDGKCFEFDDKVKNFAIRIQLKESKRVPGCFNLLEYDGQILTNNKVVAPKTAYKQYGSETLLLCENLNEDGTYTNGIMIMPLD